MKSFLYVIAQGLCYLLVVLFSGATTGWNLLIIILSVTAANIIGYVQGLNKGCDIMENIYKENNK